MTTLNDILEINISRETTAVSRAAFNIPLFLATHTNFSERARTYNSLTAVGGDFSSSSNVYKAASKLFGQTLKPPSIVVGRRNVANVVGSITTLANSTVYKLILNGITLSITSDSTATAIEIVAALKSAFNVAAIPGLSMVDHLDGSFNVSTSGTAWSITSTSNITLVNDVVTETLADALIAIDQENDVWYALTMESHIDADILAIASSIEAMNKIFITSSSSSAIKTSATTDVASLLNSHGYQRTALLYSAVADTEFPECAWVGGQLPYTPGSNTWKFKPLAGVARDRLSATESGYIKAKNCNSYESVGGVNMVSEGQMAGGEFIDIMIGVDWTKARMSERIYSRLVNLAKIPFTNPGFTIVENEIRAVLAEGIKNGLFAASPAPTVSMPNAVTMDPNLRILRRLEGITFTARLAGAVHFVSVFGTVSA